MPQWRQLELDSLFIQNPFIPPIAPLCPVHKLPVELLLRIFAFAHACHLQDCLYERNEHESHYWGVLHILEQEAISSGMTVAGEMTGYIHMGRVPGPPTVDRWFPLDISHVCRQWRNLAISTPPLWGIVTVTPTARPPYQCVSNQLDRSESCPIDLQINWRGGRIGSNSDSMLFILLVAHIHRFRSVNMGMLSKTHMTKFLAAVSNQSIPIATHLTVLKLHCAHDDDHIAHRQGPLDRFKFFGRSAPRLMSISLKGVYVDWAQPWISSASNLTTLELTHFDRYTTQYPPPSWAEFAIILRGAPHLKVLILSSWELFAEVDYEDENTAYMVDESPLIQLLELEQLDLSYMSFAFTIQLLRNLQIPTLTNLTITPTDLGMGMRETDRVYRRLVAQLVGTTLLPGIEHFHVTEFVCLREEIERLYSKLDNLRSLRISESPTFLDVLLMATSRPGQAWMPKLETITMDPIPHYWRYQEVRALVQRRRDASVPLRYLDLRQTQDWVVDDEGLGWLKTNLEISKSDEGSELLHTK